MTNTIFNICFICLFIMLIIGIITIIDIATINKYNDKLVDILGIMLIITTILLLIALTNNIIENINKQNKLYQEKLKQAHYIYNNEYLAVECYKENGGLFCTLDAGEITQVETFNKINK